MRVINIGIAVLISGLSANARAELVELSSVQPGKELWIYEYPQEERFCGSKAIREGRKRLKRWMEDREQIACEPCKKGSDCLQCEFDLGDDFYVGMHLKRKNGRNVLAVAYTWYRRAAALSTLISQRQFLNRIGTESCREHGPRTVWRPPPKNGLVKKVKQGLREGDKTLLPIREVTSYHYCECEVTSPPASRTYTQEELDDFTVYGLEETCFACGRQQPRCVECAAGMTCSSYLSFRFAREKDGVVRLVAETSFDPWQPFGGDKETIGDLMSLLGIPAY